MIMYEKKRILNMQQETISKVYSKPFVFSTFFNLSAKKLGKVKNFLGRGRLHIFRVIYNKKIKRGMRGGAPFFIMFNV